jgi:uncharacterized protein YdaU (DUF1376 family)
MSVKILHIDFWSDEWLAGTLGMTLEEEGLYIKICALIWSTGGHITCEHLKRCTRAHGNKVNAILERLEKAGKIVRNGSEICQKRAEKELENARKRVGKSRENGAKGGRPKELAKPDGFQLPVPVPVPVPVPDSKKKDSVAYATGAEAPADPVKAMWDRGKAVLGKSAGGVIGKMLGEHGPEAVVAAILACERECPVEPVEFFMGCLRRHSKKCSAVEKFYAGAMEAADEFTRWQQQQSGDSGASHAPPLSLLDGR